jgi:hypothetical protein
MKENSMASKTSKLVPIDKGPVEVTPLGLLQIAVQQGADVDKLAKLLELQERWQANQARQAHNTAMAKFKQRPRLPIPSKSRIIYLDSEVRYGDITGCSQCSGILLRSGS